MAALAHEFQHEIAAEQVPMSTMPRRVPPAAHPRQILGLAGG
jgi:hypothetical protein